MPRPLSVTLTKPSAVELDLDEGGVAGQRLVHGVVDHLGEQVMQRLLVGAADIHAGPPPHRLQTLQHLDVLGGVAGFARARGVRAARLSAAPTRCGFSMLANRSPTAAVFFGFFEDLLTVLAMRFSVERRGRERISLCAEYATARAHRAAIPLHALRILANPRRPG